MSERCERCEQIAQVAHQKWAMWANRSGRSPKMSNHERFAQVAHQKWVTMSKSLRSLTKNERFAQKTDERIPSTGSMAKKMNVDSNLWKLSSFLILGGFVKWPLHDLNFLDHWPTPQAGLHCSQILGMLPLPSWSRSRWLIFYLCCISNYVKTFLLQLYYNICNVL